MMNDMRGKESKMNEIERLKEIVRRQDELLECKEKIIQEQKKLMSKYEDIITFYRIFLLGLRDVIKEDCNAYSTDEESDSR